MPHLEDDQQVQEVDMILDGIFSQNEIAPTSKISSRQPEPMDESGLATVIDSEMSQSYGEENSELGWLWCVFRMG